MKHPGLRLKYFSLFVLLGLVHQLCFCEKNDEEDIETDLVLIADYDGNTYHT